MCAMVREGMGIGHGGLQYTLHDDRLLVEKWHGGLHSTVDM